MGLAFFQREREQRKAQVKQETKAEAVIDQNPGQTKRPKTKKARA